MEKCKFCSAQLEEGSTVCPGCGKDNAEEVTAEETAVAEETVPVQEPPAEGSMSEEQSAAEEPAPEQMLKEGEETASAEEPKTEEKKATPGKMALVIGGIVVAIAIIAALLMSGTKADAPAATDASAQETTAPTPTVPADGNPDDETCKGTYTVTDEEVIANAATVVATIGDHKLTNGQLQAFYWMQVQSFLSSEYGQYMMYYGVLDYTQPLDTQVCAMTGTGTWQQFFLAEALNSWQNYCALADRTEMNGLELTEEEQAVLDGIEANLQSNAQQYNMSVEELLKHNMGPGASLEDYLYFQELIIRGNKYYTVESEKIAPTAEELEAFFAEHEQQYAESGITKEGKTVDVRHVLFVPEGGTTDETGATTYSEEEWAACEAKAQEALDDWLAGEATEESFGMMAEALTQDPGSKNTGGLYTGVQQGQMVEAFDAWCFDEAREPGNSGMVKTNYGYHLMYFVSSTPIWENYARQDFVAEKTNAMMQELTAEYPMEVNYSAISLGLVDMAG